MIQGIIGAFGVRLPVSWLMSRQADASLFHIGLAANFLPALNRLLRTAGNARHTVGAVFAPDRFSVRKGYVVKRAAFRAFTAAYALICDGESLCVYHHRVHYRVEHI